MVTRGVLKVLIFDLLRQAENRLMSAMVEFINGLWGRYVLAPSLRHPAWAALLAGLALPLAYPPFYFLPIFYLATGLVFYLALVSRPSFTTSSPGLEAEGRKGPWRMAFLGWCFGFGQFASGMAWIGEAFLVEAELFLWALPFAVTGLPAGLGLFHALAFAAFGVAVQRFRLRGLAALCFLALLVALSEYARGHVLTGLPWNLPLMGWAGWLYLAQPVALIGIYGLSLLALLSVALLVSGLVSGLASEPAAASSRRAALWAGLALPLAAFLHSSFALHGASPSADTKTGLKVTVVQPNLAQGEKWEPALRERHIEKTFKMTALGLKYAPDTELIIWPETALPALIDEGTGFAERLAAALPRFKDADKDTAIAGKKSASPFPPPYLLTGAIRRKIGLEGTAYFNSAMLWSGEGMLLARSDKHHLVPFGEYLPLQNFLEAIGLQQLTRLRGGYSAGPAQSVLTAARLPRLAPLICYEAVFPHLAQHSHETRPAVFINLTNDGWFGKSFGPYQHLAQARLRAIEQGIPLIRAANTGMSAAFDARGRQLERLALAEEGVFSLPLPPAHAPTFYARHGDSGFVGLGFLLLIFVWAKHRRQL